MQTGPPDATEAVALFTATPAQPTTGRTCSHASAPSHAIAPDMPGYGGADKPRNFAYTLAC
jgi:hypothetical protein